MRRNPTVAGLGGEVVGRIEETQITRLEEVKEPSITAFLKMRQSGKTE